jgi:hypothetical protein
VGIFSVSTKEVFAFNLLPPRSKAEVVAEVKKKELLVNSLLAPTIVIVAIMLSLIVNFIVVEPLKRNWEKSTNSLRAELANSTSELGQLRVTNGELKLKSDFIAAPVTKNVDFERVFATVETAFKGNTSGSQPTSYGRKGDGLFIVNGISTGQTGPAEILAALDKISEVGKAELDSIGYDATKRQFNFTIAFELSALAIEES